MIEIDISQNQAKTLEELFCANEVYSYDIYREGDKWGFVDNCSSWGQAFYFVRGKLNGTTLTNAATGEKIELGA